MQPHSRLICRHSFYFLAPTLPFPQKGTNGAGTRVPGRRRAGAQTPQRPCADSEAPKVRGLENSLLPRRLLPAGLGQAGEEGQALLVQ